MDLPVKMLRIHAFSDSPREGGQNWWGVLLYLLHNFHWPSLEFIHDLVSARKLFSLMPLDPYDRVVTAWAFS